jgi:hypothetical protein
MPELLPVAEMEIDRATSRLETTKLNPTRSFAKITDRGMALFTWQNGHWFDTGSNWIPDPDATVPPEFRREIAEHPVTAGIASGPTVTKVCKFCGEEKNASDIDEHYIEHVNTAMAQAGAVSPDSVPPPATLTKPEKPKNDANQHGRG